MATLSSILAWRIQKTRSLVGYSPWGRKELDMTEGLSLIPHLKNQPPSFDPAEFCEVYNS